MFGLAPSATKEGAKGPQNGPNGHGCQKGPKPSAGAKRRGTECPEILVKLNSAHKKNSICLEGHFFVAKVFISKAVSAFTTIVCSIVRYLESIGVYKIVKIINSFNSHKPFIVSIKNIFF